MVDPGSITAYLNRSDCLLLAVDSPPLAPSPNAISLGDSSSLALAKCAPCPRSRLLLRPYITYMHIPQMPVSPGITHASKRPTQARPTVARPACDQLQAGDQPPLPSHAAEVAVTSGGWPSRSQSEPLKSRLCGQSVPQLASRYLLALAASTSSTSTTQLPTSSEPSIATGPKRGSHRVLAARCRAINRLFATIWS